ncbi:MAG TPA: RHS repeat-associated core domain-containing protein [Thermoanaerobaculia bacterium]|jgi:RHS repeat-associated protein|nr:RHS repeat-associated core domain-containing protein [Thermoanaerobaculia bacterium]
MLVCSLFAVSALAQCDTTLEVTGPAADGYVYAHTVAASNSCLVLYHIWLENPNGECITDCGADASTCTNAGNCDGHFRWWAGCFPEGEYKVKFHSGCYYAIPGDACHDGNPGIKEGSFTVDRQNVSLEISKDTTLESTLKIDYSFGPSSHSLALFVDGQDYGVPSACQVPDSGTCLVSLPFACSSGDHDIQVIANRCSGEATVTKTMKFKADECKLKQTNCNSCSSGPSDPLVALAASLGQPSGPPGICAGKPVNAGSGDVSVNFPLFDIGGPLPFRFDITFHSVRPTYYIGYMTRPLEIDWTHSFNMQIHPTDSSNKRLVLYGPTGDIRYFDKNGTIWQAAVPATSKSQVSIDAVSGDYLVSTVDGETSAFDATTGMWKSTRDRWNNSLTGTYDSNGRLASVADDYGRTVTLGYVNGLIETISLTGGATWKLHYLNSRIDKIWDPLRTTAAAPWRHITNDGSGRIVSVEDESGAVLESHSYDSQGRGTTSMVGSGHDTYTFEYDTPTAGKVRVTHTTGGIDTVTIYMLKFVKGQYLPTELQGVCPSCGTVSDTQSLTYDSDGRVLTRTDGEGHLTQYTYDGMGNVATVTEALGTTKARTTTYTYGYSSWPTFATNISRPSVAGATAKTLSRAWTSNETVLTSIASGKSGGTATSLTTVTTFDSAHRLLSLNGPRAASGGNDDVTTNSYYSSADSTINRRGRLQQTTNALGHTTSFDDYDVYGTPRTLVDVNGVTTLRTTDDRGRVLTSTNKARTGDTNDTTDYVSSTTIDGRDRVTETTSPRGTRTRFMYEDGSNWLTDTVRVDAAGNEVERRHLTLDAAGRKTSEADQLCSTPASTCTSWVTKRGDSFVYDLNGRLSEIDHTIPSGSKVVFTYDADGKQATVKDENHTTANTTYAYDALDRVASVTQKLGAGTAVTQYGYDAHDNLTTVTDPNGNVTSYVYDDFGRMRQQSSPVTAVTDYGYDEAGNLLQSTDANAATVVRTYDYLNRVLTSDAKRNNVTTESVSWVYDEAGTYHYGLGRLFEMKDATGPSGTTPSTRYSYERRGLLTTEVRKIDAETYTTSFGYDANGNRTSITYPSSRVVTFAYDFADRPLSATSGATSLVSAATYLPFGPMTSLTYSNGTTKTMTYDARYRPMENKLTGPSGTIADYLYATDAVGNITQIHDAVSSAYDRDFGYDDLNRLTSASTGASLWGTGSYSYDTMGNMLSLTLGSSRSASFTYSGTTPKLTSVTEGSVARPVTYDAAGNEAHVGGGTYSYSDRNHLAAGDGLAYRYDGRGVRAVTSIARHALSFNPGQVVGSNSSTGTVTLMAAAPTGGATITLASGDTTRVTVPASITIAAGQTSGTFTATTFAVGSTVWVPVTATWSGVAATATLALTPGTWDVDSVSVDPTDALLPSGARPSVSTTVAVTLNAAAPAGGVRAIITCSDTSDCPTSVTIPASATSATFTMTSYPNTVVLCSEDCPNANVVNATFATTKSATFTTHTEEGTWDTGLGLTASRDAYLTAMAITPGRLVGGRKATITIELSASAPEGGVQIDLSSSDPAVELPPSVFLAHSQRTLTFDVPTAAVDSERAVRITATVHGIARETSITLLPARRPLTLAFGTHLVTPYTTTSGKYERYSLYSPELNLLAETDLSLSPTLAYEYLWFAGQPVAQFDLATTTTHWTFTDHLGTPIIQTDSTAAVDWRAEYEPFGRVHAYRTGSTRHQPLRLPGQEYDERTPERDYNMFRWYRDGWGRYTQDDPLENLGLASAVFLPRGISGSDMSALLVTSAANLYSYSGANPLFAIDPSGLRSIRYDGCRAYFIDDDGRIVKSCAASSGVPGSKQADQSTKDYGPLPEGTYTLYPKEFSGGLRALVRTPGWGWWRAPLHPNKGTKTYGRDNFFLHGDTRPQPGSHGCIDVADCDRWARDWATEKPNDPITVFAYFVGGKVCN